jgi:hypothetical protein
MSGACSLGLASELFTANQTEQGTGSATVDMPAAFDPNRSLYLKRYSDQVLDVAQILIKYLKCGELPRCSLNWSMVSNRFIHRIGG